MNDLTAEPAPDLSPDQSAARPASSEPAPSEPAPSGPVPSEPTPSAEPAAEPASELSSGAVRAGAPDAVQRQNRLAGLGLVVLVVALAFGAGIAVGRATAPGATAVVQPSAAASAGPSSGASPAPTDVAGLPSDGARLGRADAKVVIEYWADYQCPFCAKFAQEVIPQLRSRILDGTVALVHRDYAFLGDESLDAAVAVRCAGREGRYWAMHDAVYAGQVGENQGAFARSRLALIAASVGLNATAFAACLDERDQLVDVLDDTAAGVRSGVTSTPSIDVNGTRFLGVTDVSSFLAAVDAAAAGASPAPLPTPQATNNPWALVRTDGREAGDPLAPVRVQLWMDYQATGSAVIAKELEPELRARITKGAISIEQVDLATLGDESVVAATAVRCVASQGGQAWMTHDVLAVSGQGAGKGIYTVTNILRFGSRIGLDVRALNDCLADPAVAAAVKAETAKGQAAGLTAGPAVVVVKRGEVIAEFSGDLDVAKILAAIDGAADR